MFESHQGGSPEDADRRSGGGEGEGLVDEGQDDLDVNALVDDFDTDTWVPPDGPSFPESYCPTTGLPTTPPELGWLFGSMTERLEWLCEQVPSSSTLLALEFMAQEPMTADERLLYALAWDRQRNAMAGAVASSHVIATTPEQPAGQTRSFESELASLDGEVLDRELALLLRRSDRSMGGELGFARRLTSLMPTAHGLLSEGRISAAHVRVLDDCTTLLTAGAVREIDATVAERATTLTPSAFRRVVRAAAEKLQPEPAERHARARRSASARLFPEDDGMATLAVLLPAIDGIAALRALDVTADRMRMPDDARTHGERQVAAFLDAVLGRSGGSAQGRSAQGGSAQGRSAQGEPAQRGSAQGEGRPRARRRTEVQVTIDWATLIGLREEPADLAGYGPLPAEAVRRLVGEPGTVLRRLVLEPDSGVLVDYGRTRYEPDEHLRGLIGARDVTCRYPGCLTPAVWCDIEHRDDFDKGGCTSCGNCGLMCRAHHNLKTHRGFRYRRTDPATGETVWSTPLGFAYRQKPARYHPGGIDTGDTTRERPPPPPSPPTRPPLPDDPPF